MLGFLRHLFGWDSDSSSSNPEGVERRQKPRTSAASVLTEKPAPQTQTSPAATNEADNTREDPELSLQEPNPSLQVPGSGSDPYDTGTFKKSDAWSTASKRRNN